MTWLHAAQYRERGLGKARSVFTIHNLEFGQDLIGKAMEAASMATTVSKGGTECSCFCYFTFQVANLNRFSVYQGTSQQDLM